MDPSTEPIGLQLLSEMSLDDSKELFLSKAAFVLILNPKKGRIKISLKIRIPIARIMKPTS